MFKYVPSIKRLLKAATVQSGLWQEIFNQLVSETQVYILALWFLCMTAAPYFFGLYLHIHSLLLANWLYLALDYLDV